METDGVPDVSYVLCLVLGLILISLRFPMLDMYIGAGMDTALNQRLVQPRVSVVVNVLVLCFATLHCFCGTGISTLAFGLLSNTYHVRDCHWIHILEQRQGIEPSGSDLAAGSGAHTWGHSGCDTGEDTDDRTAVTVLPHHGDRSAYLGASQAYGLTTLVKVAVFGSYALVAAMQLVYLHVFGDMGFAGGCNAWRSKMHGRGCLELTYQFVTLVLLAPLTWSVLALVCPGLALLTRILSGEFFASETKKMYVQGDVHAIWDIHGHATLGQGLAQAIVIFAGSILALIDFELRALPPPLIAQWMILLVVIVSAVLVIVNALLIAVLRPAGCCGWSHEELMHTAMAWQTPCFEKNCGALLLDETDTAGSPGEHPQTRASESQALLIRAAGTNGRTASTATGLRHDAAV